jgi:hypothetical protein
MNYNKNILIIIVLIIAIFLVYTLEIESEEFALSILGVTMIYLIFLWMTNKNCDDKGDSASECVIGNTKSYVGIFDNGCLDIWHVKHALLWLLIGLLAPNNYEILVLISSIAFESLEHFMFKYLCKKEPIFCGRVEDIVINTGFYYLGSYMRNKQKEQK